MEKECLVVNKNEDVAEYTETYSNERTLSFMCKKCYNIHPIIVKQEYTYNNKATIISRNDENFEKLNVDLNNVADDISKLRIPVTSKLYCPICKEYEDHYILDYKISDIISILNKAGFRTIYSCSGHEEMNSIPYVMFKPEVEEFGKYIKMIDSVSSYTDKLWRLTDGNIKLELDIEKISIVDYLDYKHLTILKDAINKYLNNKEEE